MVNGSVDFVAEVEVRDLLDTIAILPVDAPGGKFLREHVAQGFFGISGRFIFVFLAEYAEANDTLCGEVLIVSEAKHPILAKNLRRVSAEQTSTFSAFKEFLKEHLEDIEIGNGFWKSATKIFRTGEVQIKTGFETMDASQRDADQLVAEQTYYFLKDLFHIHQHHDRNSDSLTTVAKIDDEKSRSWLDTVHHSLFRSVVRYKRYRTEKHLSKSLGILAYTRAFEDTFRSQTKLKDFQTDHLRESLSVAQDEVRQRRLLRSGFVDTVRGTFFAFFAFLLSVSILIRFVDNHQVFVDPAILQISEMIIGDFWRCISLVFVFAVTIGFISHSLEPSDIRFVRMLTKTLQGFRLRYYLITNFILSFLIVMTGWWLVFY